MKVLIVWILGPLIAFGMAAVAGTTYNDRAELQDAHHSRDFAASEVCKGQPFEWEGDVLICLRERP
ncbi:hypothetical protein KW843_22905 [Acidovorax sp. sif1233]|uniref:hypothetical protein n=1 Tax=Acidovorax sp. sif1233 TaxID=2854792 RepID=UPI001C485235|nr:hypothetical protein [Acidovorax sp. sif1233]MBV7457348.1 hypothetical protein [Acidovorax sp. sif1233]